MRSPPVFLLLLPLVLSHAGVAAETPRRAQAAALPRARFVAYQPDASGLPPSVVKEGLDRYGAWLRQQGVVDLETLYFRRARDLDTRFQRWIDRGEPLPAFASFSVAYLLERGYRLGYYPVACAQVEGSTHFTYSIVAHRTSRFWSIEDGRGAVISLADIGVDVVQWMNVLVFENRLDMRSYFSRLVEAVSPASSVAAVLYRQADLAIVSTVLLDRMRRTTAPLWRDLRVIFTSRPVNLSGLSVRVGTPRDLVDRFTRELFGDVAAQPGGKELLDSFHIDGFIPCDWSTYDRLEGRYLREAGVDIEIGAARQAAIERALLHPVVERAGTVSGQP